MKSSTSIHAFLILLILGVSVGSSSSARLQDNDVPDENFEDAVYWRELFDGLGSVASGVPSSVQVAPTPPPVPECSQDTDCVDVDRFTCEDGQCILLNCVVGIEDIECCSDADCPVGSIPVRCVSNACAQKGDPSFTLTWFGDDDLDLHVITPTGVEISFENLEDETTGGELDVDKIPSEVIPFPHIGRNAENIRFPIDGTAPAGVYEYWVNNFDQLGNSSDPWEMRVFEGDTVIRTITGTTGNDLDSEHFFLTV